jgi:hypothetical protein
MENAGMEQSWINHKSAVAAIPEATVVSALTSRALQQVAATKDSNAKVVGYVAGFPIPQF